MTVTVSCIFCFATVLHFLKFTAVHVDMHRHMYHICTGFVLTLVRLFTQVVVSAVLETQLRDESVQ